MFYSLHVVEPLRYDSVLIKETNEWMSIRSQVSVLQQVANLYCAQVDSACYPQQDGKRELAYGMQDNDKALLTVT